MLIAERMAPTAQDVERGFREDLGAFQAQVHRLWHATDTAFPDLGETVPVSRQHENAQTTDRFSDELEARLRALPTDEGGREQWIQDLRPRLESFASALGMAADHREVVFSDDFFRITTDFIHRARDFDRSLELEGLFQALRNVWVMNILRRILGVEMACTSSVFAYSMLYPYTDNFLDDAGHEMLLKREVSRWLGQRLRGEAVLPRDPYETALSQLVGWIEDEYPQALFPRVWQSLLAIHRSQVESLDQQSPSTSSSDDLLALSIAKGGSSVLADGYLVHGDLRREQAEFIFGFGVVLQLLDDLQDIATDRAAGHRTIFTESPSPEATVSRLCRFMDHLLDATPFLAMEGNRVVREVIRTHCRLLLINAAGFHQEVFSASFLSGLERSAPLPFTFLRKRRGGTSKRFLRVRKMLHRRGVRSIFDLFGAR